AASTSGSTCRTTVRYTTLWGTTEQTDEWTEGRRYLGLEVLHRCRLTAVDDTRNEVNTEPDTALELSA
ncbi:hypothetical protein ACFFIO_06335, partial [Citricoccus parietis]